MLRLYKWDLVIMAFTVHVYPANFYYLQNLATNYEKIACPFYFSKLEYTMLQAKVIHAKEVHTVPACVGL